MRSDAKFLELTDLLVLLCDASLGQVGLARLEQLLLDDSELQDFYQRFVALDVELAWNITGYPALSEVGLLAGARKEGLLTELGENFGADVSAAQNVVVRERRLEACTTNGLPLDSFSPSSTPVFGFLGSAYHGTAGFFSHDVSVAWLIATVLCGLGLLIGSLVTVSRDVQISQQPSPPVAEPARIEQIEYVGRITGTVDCRWEKKGLGIGDWGSEKDSGAEIQNSELRTQKSLVSHGDKFALASGLMEITYDTGAKVILQGPCTYKVEAKNGGFLSVGKLTARVEKNEELRTKNEEVSASRSPLLVPRSYFAVRTPTAIVTDLSTEFGVEVSEDGRTISHVFRGSIKLQATPVDGKGESTVHILHENESARVDIGGVTGRGNRVVVVGPSAKPTDFVRTLVRPPVKTFDLVDVVAGGDGFSGRRNRGIHPATGQIMETVTKPEDLSITGDGKYHRVEGLPFVDGVFIPNGDGGPVQVDSAGHAFDAFSYTTNTTSGCLWAGGVIPLLPLTAPVQTIPTKLNDIDYSSPGHGLLFLHANKGVTFDLDAIRRATPDYRLGRFLAVAGSTEACADLWVLVDGKSRYQRRQINAVHGGFAIAVPIGEKDRFLTLTATDGGDGIGGDWIVFGDPRLELLPVPTGERRSTDNEMTK